MKKSFWHQIPIVRLLLPFAAGIGTALNNPLPLGLAVALFALSLSLTLVFLFGFQQYHQRRLFGMSVVCCLFAAGMAMHAWQSDLASPNHYRYQPHIRMVVVVVNEQPIPKPASYKMTCRVLAVVDSAGNIQAATGKLLLSVEKSPVLHLSYGAVVAIPRSLLRPVPGPQNPEAFDYKRYLALLQVHDQAYCRATQLVVLPANKGYALQKGVYRLQAYFKSVLSRCIASANETGVAEALLYGYDDGIDAETVQAYSNTGTLHVLAVSGMHVGLIFMLLSVFLKPLDKHKRLQLVKHLVILAVLWLYSVLCGLSPSILRATVMFSFIIVASILRIRSNVYNTLAASAFVLLCVDTNMLANIGFQLSYLAVLGIVFFQSFVYNWYAPSHKLLDELWKVTSVSLSAQLATFPIGLLYFHQFPNCFLFSNLIIIPLTTLILYMAMVLLLLAPFSWLSWLLGQTLFHTIAFTNSIVKGLERVPYAYVNGIYISPVQCVVLYVLIACGTAFFLLRRPVYLKLFVVCATGFVSIQAWHQWDNTRQHRLVVYAIRRHTVVQLMRGNEGWFIGDSALLHDRNAFRFHLQQHLWKSGITQIRNTYLDSGWKQVNIKNYCMVVSGKSRAVVPVPSCSLLLVQHPLRTAQLDAIGLPAQVIISTAVAPQQARAIVDYWERKNIPVRYVGETGAIEVSLPH